MRGKKFIRSVAVCLVFVLVVGGIPNLGNRMDTRAVAAEVAENGSDTVSGSAGDVASGGAVNIDLSAYITEAPASVTVRGGSKRVRITWNAVAYADGYYIYSRPSTSASYTKAATIKNGATVTYTKTGLVQNTTYYFRVCAYREVNGVIVEGTLSTAASAKTAGVAATSKAAKKYGTKTLFKKSPAYKKYTKMRNSLSYTRSFAIPGMKTTNVAGFACTSMVPQAICYAGSYLLISAYDSKGVDYSVIYVVSKSAKSYITTIVLPSKAKIGGMAYDGTNIWVTKGSYAACFPYSYVTDAVNSGSAYKSLSAYSSVCKVDTSAGYMGYYNGTLWVGPTKAASTTMYGYQINDVGTKLTLTRKYSMVMPSRTQGLTFNSDGTMIVTRSYRTKSSLSGYVSQVRTYVPSYGSADANGKILKNNALAVSKMPPLVEGVAVYGSYTYAVFSSSHYGSCKYPVDRVLALKTAKLIA